MTKIEIMENIYKRKQDNKDIYVVSLPKEGCIDNEAVHYLTKRAIKALFKLEPVERSKNYEISYFVQEGVSLKSWLQCCETSADDIKNIIEQIIQVIQEVESVQLNSNCIVLDIDYIHINHNKELSYIYIPYETKDTTQDSLKTFLVRLCEEVWRTTKKSDISFNKELINYYRQEDFSIKGLQEYLRESKGVMKIIKRLFKSSKKTSNNEGFIIQTQKENSLCEISHIEKLNEDTLLINEEEVKQTELFQTTPDIDLILRISNSNTNLIKQVQVRQFPFRVGRASQISELKIEDNKVSRLHMTIVNKKEITYVIDENSSNGTYLNGSKILPQVEIEIKDEDVINIGNTEIGIIIN